MANVLGAARPPAMALDERVHHLFARFPDVKVHLYGKAERPARKIGHVTVLGDDLGRRARAGRRWPRPGSPPREWADGWSAHRARPAGGAACLTRSSA